MVDNARTIEDPSAMLKDRLDPALAWLDDELRRLDDRGLRRQLTTVEDRRPGEVRVSSRWLHDFSGNDYLGLTRHPDCIDAAQQALCSQGCGSASSRIVIGGIPPHRVLEESLERFTGAACLVFPSGYQANLGMISSLCQRQDTIFSDAHNHASIVDGCRFSGARIRIYPHGRWDVLEEWLSEPEDGRRWIVTDTVFSMDGSLAPVEHLARLGEAHQVPLLVDEAHAMGVLGPGGRGYCAQQGVRPQVLMGTFSKGLGSHGAFTASCDVLAQWLLNRTRSFIYTTAMPPAVVGASAQALAVSDSAEGDRLRRRVLSLANTLRARLREEGLDPTGDGSPIVSLPFEDSTRASVIQARLSEAGYLAWAFRPPTVPLGTSRLRISLSASHSTAQVDGLGETLIRALGSHAPRNHV
jgi:8-amino-7-oxononanoate synthase